MRTFVALNLAAAERDRLYAALEPLRERDLPIRWTAADSLHLTLKFLGEIEGSEVARIEETMRGIARRHAPLTLRIGGVGAFPAIRRASIVWVGVQSDPAVLSLQRDVELAMSRLGYTRDYKTYRPHITVGRTRNESRAPDLERHTGAVRYESSVQVETMDLMRSHTGAGGSRYEPLLRIALGSKKETGEGAE
jgi:2'-5' RNA ligase